MIGGLIPLAGYLFSSTPKEGLIISAIITIICLFTFGFFKSKVTGQPTISGALKVTLIGVIAAASAFIIAKLISE
jgi:VIT1/CCC1 family predicted Fe2+/Mn2+ transporter